MEMRDEIKNGLQIIREFGSTGTHLKINWQSWIELRVRVVLFFLNRRIYAQELFRTSEGALTIRFTSDYSVTRRGFLLFVYSEGAFIHWLKVQYGARIKHRHFLSVLCKIQEKMTKDFKQIYNLLWVLARSGFFSAFGNKKHVFLAVRSEEC